MAFSCESFTCTNRNASLKHHRNSLRGTVLDFIITFDSEESSIEGIVAIASNMFELLCERLSSDGKSLKGDLCAKVKYWRGTTGHEESYFHCSS